MPQTPHGVRSEALQSWQRTQQSPTRASRWSPSGTHRYDPRRSTRVNNLWAGGMNQKGGRHDLIFVDDLICWCWNMILDKYIYDLTVKNRWFEGTEAGSETFLSLHAAQIRPWRSLYHPDFVAMSSRLCLNSAPKPRAFAWGWIARRHGFSRSFLASGLSHDPDATKASDHLPSAEERVEKKHLDNTHTYRII